MKTSEPTRLFKASDLAAVVQLATQATAGVVDITEGVHHAVHRSMGLSRTAPAGRTSGLTGWVYRSIHTTNHLIGQGLGRALARAFPLTATEGDSPTSGTSGTDAPAREALISALNGVMGDHLVATHNPLALGMQVRWQHHTLWTAGGAAAPQGALPESPSPHVLLLIHGLCMNDRQWLHQGHDHGAHLAQALGCTPVYLRYNTGRHVWDNGATLSALLETVLKHWPVPVQSLRIVTHSMGGLVARSACHAAAQAHHDWLRHLSHLVFLGTPHHGAPLEQAGAWADTLLADAPGLARYTRPFAPLGQVRSAGITDLRHGNVTAADGQGRERVHRLTDTRHPLPLPVGVACFAVAASLTSGRSVLAERLSGDGLVPLRSALGQHTDPRHHLAIAVEHQQVVRGLGHIGLLGSPVVAAQLRKWLTPA